jgi:hypothetical protein
LTFNSTYGGCVGVTGGPPPPPPPFKALAISASLILILPYEVNRLLFLE